MSDQPCQNTDRELWREREGDFYADSIHVTEGGGIGINCDGMVHVKPLREWHKLAGRRPFSDQLAQEVIDGQVKEIDRLTKLIQKEREERIVAPEARAIDPDYALMQMVRVYHGFDTDKDLIDNVGYGLELYVAKMREALKAAGIPLPQNGEQGDPK